MVLLAAGYSIGFLAAIVVGALFMGRWYEPARAYWFYCCNSPFGPVATDYEIGY